MKLTYPLDKQVTVAITGASGAPYALRLIDALIQANYQVHVLVSSAAKVVFATETDEKLPSKPQQIAEYFIEKFAAQPDQVKCYGKDEWFSPVASGSAAPKKMVVVPCSTGSLSAIAIGASDNLIERAADVVIKEQGKLVVVPREAPFSAIHLENMLKLAKLGVTVLPAAPGFYHKPESIDDLVDFVVARILEHIGIEQTLVDRWGYQK